MLPSSGNELNCIRVSKDFDRIFKSHLSIPIFHTSLNIMSTIVTSAPTSAAAPAEKWYQKLGRTVGKFNSILASVEEVSTQIEAVVNNGKPVSPQAPSAAPAKRKWYEKLGHSVEKFSSTLDSVEQVSTSIEAVITGKPTPPKKATAGRAKSPKPGAAKTPVQKSAKAGSSSASATARIPSPTVTPAPASAPLFVYVAPTPAPASAPYHTSASPPQHQALPPPPAQVQYPPPQAQYPQSQVQYYNNDGYQDYSDKRADTIMAAAGGALLAGGGALAYDQYENQQEPQDAGSEPELGDFQDTAPEEGEDWSEQFVQSDEGGESGDYDQVGSGDDNDY
jgi:hypothetical protein